MTVGLQKEVEQATSMLAGKTVIVVRRHRPKELGIEFTDGTRLFVDWQERGELEISITGDFENIGDG